MTATQLRPAHTTPATLTDWQRRMYSASAPETVGCDFCNAASGFQCTSSGGYTVAYHAARHKAVAHLTEDERVAAYAALQDQRRRSREAWEAEYRRNLADPAWVARRDAVRAQVNAAFDAAREQAAAAERDFRSRCADRPFRGSRTHADNCHCKTTGEVEYTPQFAEARRLRELRGTLPVTDLAAARAARRVS